MQSSFANIIKNKKAISSAMTFCELYKEMTAAERPLPSQKLIKKLSELTKKSEMTVRGWACGRVPAPLEQEIVAKHLGIPAHILFPPRDKKKKGAKK